MKAKYLVTALVLILLLPAIDYARTWKDKFGQTTEGKFVRVTGDAVVILRGNKPVAVPLEQLSDEDQEYVRSQTQKTKATVDTSRKKIENPFEEAEKESKTSATKTPASDKKDAPSASDGDLTERTWVDLIGNRLVAKFITLEGSMVVLSKDGVTKKYPLDNFSVADRQYIDQQAQKLRKEGKLAATSDAALAGGNSPVNNGSSAPPPSTATNSRQQSMLSRGQEILQKMEADRVARQAQMEAQQARQAQMEAERQRFEQEARLRAESQQTANSSPLPNQPGRFAGQPPMPPSPTPPQMTDIPMPQYTQTHVYYCTKCNKEISANAKVGDSCPHCGVVWDFQKNEKGEIIKTSPGRQFSGIIKIVSGVIVIVFILIGIFNRRS